MSLCPYCESDISDTARKCKYCGEWISGPKSESSQPVYQPDPTHGHAGYVPQDRRPITTQPGGNVNVNVQQEESVLFAVITLIFLLLLYPIGLVLNIVGLITGPKRGCFFAMFFVFVLLPIGTTVILLLLGVGFMDEIMKVIEELSRQNR